MNRTVITLLLVACSSTLWAKTTWTIRQKTYDVDTLEHITIGPGTTQTKLKVTGPTGTHNIFYNTVQLDNEYVEMRVAKAGDAYLALETVPEIAQRYDRPGENYFTGINGDFFNMSAPYQWSLGATIQNGSYASYVAPASSADIDDYYLCFDNDGVPTFARHITVPTTGRATYPDGTTSTLYFNTNRNTDYLVIYTHQWNSGKTGVNEYGSEVTLKPVDNTHSMWGSTCQLEVVDDPVTQTSNIPVGGYVLSGHGTSRTKLNSLKKGDIIEVNFDFRADGTPFAAKEVIGGYPYLIYDNEIQRVLSYPAHLSTNEPRTAVGYTEDKSKLIMLVVDGRGAGGSTGVTQRMLADIMQNLECSHAMNFDGGGSSTMYTDRLGVRNVPSSSSLDSRPEGTPRTVVNALFAVAISPQDDEIAAIEIREKRLDLNTGDTYTPTVYGYNRYGSLIDTDVQGFSCHTSPALTSLSGNTITADSEQYKGALTVEYGSLSYSIPVFINYADEDDDLGGIVDTVTDTDCNSPVEYFTTQGLRIINPAAGTLVIRRQGSQVTKLIIK